MGLSSNSIIHFSNKKGLEGILGKNFGMKYCKETLYTNYSDPIELYVPMISFCDIPLSETKEHIGKYGNYGIGLTKEWAKNNNLNPVLYIEQNSYLTRSYISVFKDTKDTKEMTAKKNTLNILRYMKNYEADLLRGRKITKNYRFSDEREWRYVADINSANIKFLITKAEYDKNKHGRLLPNVSLKFEPRDIKYIIIKNDNEIEHFINLLRNAKGKTYTQFDIERLTTRIITAEQIKSDF
jgi:hypothetical protein